MRLVNAAIVPESWIPHDLLWIIRAGMKMDNETLTNIVLGGCLLAENLWRFSPFTHSDDKDE